MNFHLIDRIIEVTEGEGIRASKTLSLAEEYLADHFPGYPVLPGVLMVEAMTQTAAWYVRSTEELANPLVLLREVSHVKFANFVTPGDTLLLDLAFKKRDDEARTTQFRGKGFLVRAGESLPAAGADLKGLPLACQAKITVGAVDVREVAPELDDSQAGATEARLREGLQQHLNVLQLAQRAG